MDSTQASKPVQHLNFQSFTNIFYQGMHKFGQTVNVRNNTIQQLVKPYFAQKDFEDFIANRRSEYQKYMNVLASDWNKFNEDYQGLIAEVDIPYEDFITKSQSLYEKLFMGLNQGVEGMFESMQVNLGDNVSESVRNRCLAINESTNEIDEVKGVIKQLGVITQNLMFQKEEVEVLSSEKKSHLIEVLTKNLSLVKGVYVVTATFIVNIFNNHSAQFNKMQLDEHESQLRVSQYEYIKKLMQFTKAIEIDLQGKLESAKGMSNKKDLLVLMQQSLKIRNEFKHVVKDLSIWCQRQYNLYTKVLQNKKTMSEKEDQIIIDQYNQSVGKLNEKFKELNEITSTSITAFADNIVSKEEAKAAPAKKITFAETVRVLDFNYQAKVEGLLQPSYEEPAKLEGGDTRNNYETYLKSEDGKVAYRTWKESDGKVLSHLTEMGSPTKRKSTALESAGGGGGSK